MNTIYVVLELQDGDSEQVVGLDWRQFGLVPSGCVYPLCFFNTYEEAQECCERYSTEYPHSYYVCKIKKGNNKK